MKNVNLRRLLPIVLSIVVVAGLILIWQGTKQINLNRPNTSSNIVTNTIESIPEKLNNIEVEPTQTETTVALPETQDIEFKKVTLEGHDSDIVAVSYSPNGKYLASIDESGWVILWDASTFTKIQDWFGYDYVCSEWCYVQDLVVSNDGSTIAFSDNQTEAIYIWNSEGELLYRLDEESEFYEDMSVVVFETGISISPDGYYLAFNQLKNNIIGVEIFSINEGQFLNRIENALLGDFSQSSPYLLVLNRRSETQYELWNIDTNTNVQTFDPLPSGAEKLAGVLYPQFSLDETMLTDGRFIWDVNKGIIIADLHSEAANLFYSSIIHPQFSKDSAYTITTSEKMIYLYSTESGELVHEIEVSALCNLYYLKIAPDMEKYACAIKNRIVIREFPFLLDQ